MVITSRKDFVLPNGLDLKFLNPDFLNHIWPITMLNSSMQSLLTVGAIFIVAFIIAIILGFIGRGMPRIPGFIFSAVFFLLAIFIAYAGFVSIKHWNAPNSVAESSIGQANDSTYVWLQANGINVTKEQSLALVCDYYQAKSSFCTGVQPTGMVGGGQRDLKMNVDKNGFMILIDDKNQIPLIEPSGDNY